MNERWVPTFIANRKRCFVRLIRKKIVFILKSLLGNILSHTYPLYANVAEYTLLPDQLMVSIFYIFFLKTLRNHWQNWLKLQYLCVVQIRQKRIRTPLNCFFFSLHSFISFEHLPLWVV